MKTLLALFAAGVSFAGLGETLVFAPGNGAVTNVNEVLNGTLDIQINEASSGGGIVNLMSPYNCFNGSAIVKSGTLGVMKLSPDNVPSSLGLSPDCLKLGNGTFRYLGANGGVADIDLLVSSATDDGACIIDARNDFTFFGKADCEKGAFVKTGPGKFTMATLARSDGGTNHFNTSLYGKYYNYAFNETPNGDSPANGYYSFTVNEGTMALSNAAQVVTVLGHSLDTQNSGSVVAVGIPDDANEEERYAHLDIYGGKTLVGGQLNIGNYEKAPSSPDAKCKGSSLNIYGGEVSRLDKSKDLTIIVGAVKTLGEDVSTPSLNIYGGTLDFQYVRLGDNRGSKAKLFISGGVMKGYGLYGAHQVALSGTAKSQAEVHVCSNGILAVQQIVPTRDGDCDFTIKLTDGGTLTRTRAFAMRAVENNRMDFFFDGGVYNANGLFDLLPACYTMRLGKQQSKIAFTAGSGTCTISAPIVSDGEYDGGLEFTSAHATVLIVRGGGNFNGPVNVPENVTLRIENKNISTGPLVTPYDLKLEFAYTNSAFAMLNASEWDVHGKTVVKFSGPYPAGTYDIISVPYSSAFNHEDIVLDSAGTKDASFSSRTENGRTVVSVTFASRGNTATAQWQNPAGGDWNTAANWSSGTVPSGVNVKAVFPVNSSAAGTQVNLASEVTLSGLDLVASPGYRFAGGKFVFDNPGLEAKVSVAKGTAVVDSGVALSGLTEFNAALSSSLEVGGVVSGSSPLIVNSFSSTGGVVKLTGENTFTSGIRVGSGKLVVDSVADTGVASPLGKGSSVTINAGTFEFAGEEGETDKTFVLASDYYHSSAISVVEDATLALDGPFLCYAGSFAKKGKGTLLLKGEGTYEFGNNCYFYGVNIDTVHYPDNYDAPKSFFAGMFIAGTTRWGLDNQRVHVKGGLAVGMHSTLKANAETHAELVVDGGETVVDGEFRLGLNHGNGDNAECGVLTNRFVMNGGTMKVGSFHISNREKGFDKGAQVSEFVLNDGVFRIDGGVFNLGVKTAATDSKVDFTINGGSLIYDAETIDPNVYIGSGTNPPNVTVTLNGGLFDIAETLRFSWEHKDKIPHTVNINEGASLRTALISASGTVKHAVNWNGGKWKAHKKKTSSIANNIYVDIGEKGMILDTSDGYKYEAFNLSGTLRTMSGVANDGGITVMSEGSATDASLPWATFYTGKCNFNGAVTCAKGGIAKSTGDILSGKKVVVKTGGGFAAGNLDGKEVKVKSLVLEDGASIFSQMLTAASSIPVRVVDSLSVQGTVYVGIFKKRMDTYANPGTYAVIRAPKGTLDPSKFALSPRYASAAGEFRLDTSSDSYDQIDLVLVSANIANDYASYVWNASSGEWTLTSNWVSGVVPQNKAKEEIVIPSTVSDGSTIDLQGNRTFSALKSHAKGEVYLSGGALTPVQDRLNALIETTDGTLRMGDVIPVADSQLDFQTSAGSTQIVEGVVASSSAVNVNTTRDNAGTVRFENAVSASKINLSSGTLEGPAGVFDSNTVEIENSTLRFTEGGVSDIPEITDYNNGRGMNLDVEEDTFLTGYVLCTGPFAKTGEGTLYLTYPGTLHLGQSNRTVSDAKNALWLMPENGDLPSLNLGVFSLVAGKIVMGIVPGQKVVVAGRMDIGQNIADFDEEGNVIDSEFEIRSGTLEVKGDINIGRNAGVYRQYRDSGEKKRNLSLTLVDGTVTCNGLYMGHDSPRYYNGTVSLNIHNGLFKTTGAYVYMSHNTTGYLLDYGKAKAEVNIYGGTFMSTATKISTGGHHHQADFAINLYGGEYSWMVPYMVLGGTAGQKGVFNLHGGTFIAPCITREGTSGDIGFHWNGGTYKPTSNDVAFVCKKPWSYNIVSTKGAILDIANGNVFTLNQAFTHDEELGANEDGGVEKRGDGTLLMECANTFNGPCTVSGGVMRPSLAAAVPGGIVANGSGRFDMNGLAITVPYLKGDGGLVDNGVLTVANLIEPLSSVTVANLVLGNNAVFKSHHSYDEEKSAWNSNFFKVLSSVSGGFAIDLGHDPDYLIPDTFDIKVAEFARGVEEPKTVLVNVGRTNPQYVIRRDRRVNSEGNTELWVTLGNSGLIMILK